MAYTVVRNQGGLQRGETAVRLATGELVAVRVRSERNSNGSGTTFFAYARQIEKDGATKACPNGKPVAIETSHSVPVDLVQEHGPDAFAREMLLLVLGEEPAATMPTTVDEAAHAAIADTLPADATINPTADQAPLLSLPDSHRMNASIAHAVVAARQSGLHSAASLL